MGVFWWFLCGCCSGFIFVCLEGCIVCFVVLIVFALFFFVVFGGFGGYCSLLLLLSVYGRY